MTTALLAGADLAISSRVSSSVRQTWMFFLSTPSTGGTKGRLPVAKDTAKPLSASAAQSRDANVRVAFTILNARLLAAGGDVAGALAALEGARKSAAKDNLIEHGLRLRLVAGQIEMKGGREKAGRARLQTLSKEAETAGFGLIARLSKELISR